MQKIRSYLSFIVNKMKISTSLTIGNVKNAPSVTQECWQEALLSYCDLADEIVVVDGSGTIKRSDVPGKNVKVVYLPWQHNWSWEQLPKAMNAGLEACTGSWVIRCDRDYIFHEKDISAIRAKLEQLEDYPVATFQKFSFVLHDRYYEKGRVPIAINKGKFPNYKFGQATNTKTDLCYPIKVTGKNDKGIPEGLYEPKKFGNVGLPFYNYDYSFATKEYTKNEFWRFAQAYQRYFGEWKFGNNKSESFKVFVDMMKGRLGKCLYEIGEDRGGNHHGTHPKYIQNRIDELTEKQFAHSGWNILN